MIKKPKLNRLCLYSSGSAKRREEWTKLCCAFMPTTIPVQLWCRKKSGCESPDPGKDVEVVLSAWNWVEGNEELAEK